MQSGADDMVDGEGNGNARRASTTACGARCYRARSRRPGTIKRRCGTPAAKEAAENIEAMLPIAGPTMSDFCVECLLEAAADSTSAHPGVTHDRREGAVYQAT